MKHKRLGEFGDFLAVGNYNKDLANLCSLVINRGHNAWAESVRCGWYGMGIQQLKEKKMYVHPRVEERWERHVRLVHLKIGSYRCAIGELMIRANAKTGLA